MRYPDYYGLASPFSDGDSDSDSDAPDTPAEQETRCGRGRSPFAPQPAVYEARPATVESGALGADAEAERPRSRSGARKSVNFAAAADRPRVVFRYPSEDLVLGEIPLFEEDEPCGDAAAEDDEWWWQGWEEMAEAPAAQDQGEKLISATFDLRDAFPLEEDDH